MRVASLIGKIEPFYVMEVAKAASQLAREVAHTDRPMIFLNIGEPDFTAPPLVQEAAARAIRDGKTQYTQATGLEPLRERISQWYRDRFGVDVPARRIVVTAGASAALQLACLALVEAGEQILMPDPSYPCNCHFVTVAQGEPVRLPATAAERYQLTAAKIEEHWGAQVARRPAGLAVQPHRHLHPSRRAAPHPQLRERQGRHHAARRNLPGPELRRDLRPHGPGDWTTRSSASTASPSTST